MKGFLFATLAMTASAAIGFADGNNPAKYSPQALVRVIERVQQHSPRITGSHRQAVVLFDLDDTLINTRERTLRILKDFASQEKVRQSFPNDCERILSLTTPQISFSLAQALGGVGVANPDVIQQASDFWNAHFFTDEYAAHDKQNPGASKYLNILARAGAKIVYMTGRDAPHMKKGTIISLRRNRFPGLQYGAILLLKPNKDISDIKFKEDQYELVKTMGEVVGVFENEPANINSMARAFPGAEAIFLDTIHSATTEVPLPQVKIVRDFRF